MTTPASDPAPGRTAAAAIACWCVALPLLIALPWAPWGLWWLAPISVAPAAALALAEGWRTRTLACLVFLAAAPAWLSLEWWIGEVSAAGLPALVTFLSAWSACEFLLLRWIIRRRPRWPLWLSCPVAIVTVEWLRGEVVLDGYPWFAHGIPLVEWPLAAQVADLTGVAALTAVASIVSAGCVLCLRQRWRQGAAVIVAVAAAVLGYGAWRLSQGMGAQGAQGPNGVRILVVQTNLPTSLKLAWTPAEQVQSVLSWERLSRDALRDEAGCQLVVWPETVVPGFGLEERVTTFMEEGGYYPGTHYRATLDRLVQEAGVPFLVGSHATEGLRAEDRRWAFDALYNSAYLLDGGGSLQRYDKVFLTPFGETMPLLSRWDWLEERLLALGAAGMTFDLQAGGDPSPLVAPGGLRLATPICFEDTVPRVVRSLVWQGGERAADIIVNLSNDGWFGRSDAGRRHHLTMARGRAIENRTPLVRCANTGISCAVSATGELLWAAPPGVECTHAVEVEPGRATPPFAHLGDVLSPAAFAMCLLALIAPWIRRPSPRRAALSAPGAVAAPLLGACVISFAAACGSQQTLPPIEGRPWSTKSASVVDPVAAAAGRPARLAQESKEQGFTVTPDLGGEQNATDLLLQATGASSPELRARAIEGLRGSPAVLASVAERLVGDPAPVVRYATAIIVGDEKMCGIAPLTRPLLLDASPAVRAAALYALARCGEPIDLTPLGTILLGPDERDASVVAVILGKLGNPSAIPLLAEAAQRTSRRAGADVQAIFMLQVAAALVELGDESQLDPLRAALFQTEARAELIGLSCQLIGELGDRGAMPYLYRVMGAEGQQARPLEIRLIAAESWVRLGGQPLEGPEFLGLEGAASGEAMIRAQAAFTLGAVATPAARSALSKLLADENPNVQVAAAAAILRRPSRGP